MDYDIYDYLDQDLAEKMIQTLLSNWFAHSQYGHLYTDGIRQHMRTLQARYDTEDQWGLVKWFYTYIIYLLRQHALDGQSERFLEFPNLYRVLTTLPPLEFLVQDKRTLEVLKARIRTSWEEMLDGELSYVVENRFLKNIFRALDQRHEEFLWEKKRRFKLWHEELIATVMNPDRLNRLAQEAGMDFMDYTAVI